MESIPNREDWENKIVDDETNRLYVRTEDHPDGELIMGTEIKDFIRNLLQSHNNALVAEIEIRILKQLIQRETHLKETLEKIKKPTDVKMQGMIEIINNNI